LRVRPDSIDFVVVVVVVVVRVVVEEPGGCLVPVVEFVSSLSLDPAALVVVVVPATVDRDDARRPRGARKQVVARFLHSVD
jgi:hypothetical protein